MPGRPPLLPSLPHLCWPSPYSEQEPGGKWELRPSTHTLHSHTLVQSRSLQAARNHAVPGGCPGHGPSSPAQHLYCLSECFLFKSMDFAFHHVVHYILGSFILPNRNCVPSGQHLPVSPQPQPPSDHSTFCSDELESFTTHMGVRSRGIYLFASGLAHLAVSSTFIRVVTRAGFPS